MFCMLFIHFSWNLQAARLLSIWWNSRLAHPPPQQCSCGRREHIKSLCFVFVAHFRLMDVLIKTHLPTTTTMLWQCNPRMHVILVTKMLVTCVERNILNVACFATNWFLLLLSCIECNPTFTFPIILDIATTSFWFIQWFGLTVDNSLWSNTRVRISFCWFTSLASNNRLK